MTVADKARLAAFFGRLALKEHLVPGLSVRPLVAELFLTENCNLRCVSCACWRSTTDEELDTDEWRDVLDQLAGLRFLKVNFTGGEPLLRDDAEELMRHARRVGIPQRHLNTNAVLLDDSRRERVLDAGVTSFNVSVDGPTSELHDRVRGVDGAFATTLGHLRALVADPRATKVQMSFPVLRDVRTDRYPYPG